MKKIVFFFLFILFVKNVFCQTPDWEWAKGCGSYGTDYCTSITTDSKGDIYMVGYFQGTPITFDTIALYNTQANNSDLFIVKYNPSGNVLWAKNAIGKYDDAANAVVTDSHGNVYVTGSFSSRTITFDSVTLVNSDTNKTYSNIFLVKFNSNGSAVWARSAGKSYGNTSNCLSIDIDGNILIGGFYRDSTISFDIINLPNKGMLDIFIAKYDTSGKVIWAKGFGSNYNDEGLGLASDIYGNSYLTGRSSSLNLSFDTITLVNSGSTDIFIVKFDKSGNVIWAKRGGCIGGNNSQALACDSVGNIYVTGYFDCPSFKLDNITLNNTMGGRSAFIAKYDTNGNIQWAKGTGGYSDNVGRAVTVDISGFPYITGWYGDSLLTLDNITIKNNSEAGYADMFVVKYDTSGIVEWAKDVGGIYSDAGYAITIGKVGSIYVAGIYRGDTVKFGGNILIYPATFYPANVDLFIAKLSTISLSNSNSETIKYSALIIYPTPLTSSSTLQLTTQLKDAEVIICDMLGHEMMRKKMNGDRMEIERGSLESGVYFVKVRSGEKDWVEKIVVQ